MALSASAYRAQLQALLPPGAAWSKSAGSQLTGLLDAWAQELARLDAAATNVLGEIDPRTLFDLLTDWERVAGLPDECSALGETLQQRRGALWARLTGRGGQSKAFFIELAKAIGYDIAISEFRPFQAGVSQAGDDLTNETWLHRWMVRAPETTVFEFKAGQSVAGEPVRSWGDAVLECSISTRKPAHTAVSFAYGL